MRCTSSGEPRDQAGKEEAMNQGHGKILEAVRERNALKAERRIRKHLRTSLRVAWPPQLQKTL